MMDDGYTEICFVAIQHRCLPLIYDVVKVSSVRSLRCCCSSSWSTVGRRSPFGLAMVALDRRLWVIGQQTRYGLSIETKTNQISQSWCDDVSQPLGRALHPIFAREAPRTLSNESACFKRTRKIQNHDTNHLLNAKVVQHHLKE